MPRCRAESEYRRDIAMRILVITAHDAVNLSIENVVREFIREGMKLAFLREEWRIDTFACLRSCTNRGKSSIMRE